MTIIAIPAVADGHLPDGGRARPAYRIAESCAVGLALVCWGFFLTHATGGRDAWVLSVAIVTALVALGVTRPWRRLSAGTLSLAAAVALAPVLVCLIDPTHWFGASQAATYSYSAVLYVAVRAYAGTPVRRLFVLAVVIGAGVAQFAWSMIPWVGGGDPSAILVGTFYWHNQYAVFLLAPAVIGAGLAAVGHGQLRFVGALMAVLGCAGIVLSTSRATMGLLFAGWVVAAVLALVRASGLRARLAVSVRVLLVSAAAATVTLLLPGPPLFAHRVSAFAATATRGSSQSVGQNTGFREQFWRQSLEVFARHPWTGGGFASFGRESGRLDPQAAHSSLVHSGVLQPLSDGGLLLAVPFLLVCLLAGLAMLRRLGSDAWRADQGMVGLAALGTLLLIAHSAVDFDWTYPSLMAMTAILAATAAAWTPHAAEPSPPSAPRLTLAACAVLAVSAIVLAVPAHRGGWRLSAPEHQPTASAATSVTGDPAS